MTLPTEVPFQKLLDALIDAEIKFNPAFLQRFSDISAEECDQLAQIWQKIPLWRRQALMEDVEQLAEGDNLLWFVDLGRLASSDTDARVRLLAVRTLWLYEENDLIPDFLRLLEDSESSVRSAAAGALGRFVFAGELEEIRPDKLHQIEERLLGLIRGEDLPEVRRAALESMGYSSRDEMNALIEKALSSKDRKWEASAICAMGRSANKRWHPQVLRMLESNHPSLRSEAARAAGELEIEDAVPLLLDLLEDPDETTRLASIWSLSQIGGEGVRETLEMMYDELENEEDLEFLEQALDNLSFTEDLQLMPLFDFPDEQDETEDDELGDLFNDEEDLDY